LDQAPTAIAPKVPEAAPTAPSAQVKDEKISSYKMFKNLKMAQESSDNAKI
jgi:hypothetical protein